MVATRWARFRHLRAAGLCTLTVLGTIPAAAQDATDDAPARIRSEGLDHSNVMTYAEQLTDRIGPRLTGSPGFDRAADWAIAQLRAMGVVVSRENWGPFGAAWTHIGTSLLLSEPTPATLLAQATPWSPPTGGEIRAPLLLVPRIRDRSELLQWRGKVAGRIILYGAPPTKAPPTRTMIPLAEQILKVSNPVPSRDLRAMSLAMIADGDLAEEAARFFAREGARAILVSNGEGAVFAVDDYAALGNFGHEQAHRQPLPSAVVSPDGYGRLARLCASGSAPVVRLKIEAEFLADQVDGYNVVAEIPGSDPRLRKQVVMLGGHLDSWTAGTGATDDGAAVAIMLEVARIIKAAGVQPRRTIRFGFWGGEEQGELGSIGYVHRHLATVHFLPEPGRPAPLNLSRTEGFTPYPAWREFSAYFNLDGGGGHIFGISTEGNATAARLFAVWGQPIRDLGFGTVGLGHVDGVDTESFLAAGLPAFQFRQDLRDYDVRTHHTNLDTYERLSAAELKQAATVAATLVYQAAQADAMVPRALGRVVPRSSRRPQP